MERANIYQRMLDQVIWELDVSSTGLVIVLGLLIMLPGICKSFVSVMFIAGKLRRVSTDGFHNLDPPKNCDLEQCNFNIFLRLHNFAVERNFCATLATFVSFEVAWIQTVTVVSCDC